MPRDRSDLGKAEVANLGYVLAKWWTANGAKTNAKLKILSDDMIYYKETSGL